LALTLFTELPRAKVFSGNEACGVRKN
jgi:hypothetical protein